MSCATSCHGATSPAVRNHAASSGMVGSVGRIASVAQGARDVEDAEPGADGAVGAAGWVGRIGSPPRKGVKTLEGPPLSAQTR